MADNEESFGESTENWFAESPDYTRQNQTLVVDPDVADWIDALKQRGLLSENAAGGTFVAPGVDRLLKAIHVVLTGGRVSVSVDEDPDEKGRNELDRKLNQALVSLMRSSTKR